MTKLHATSAEDEEPECQGHFNANGGASSAHPVMRLEPELYAEHVEDLGLTEDQEQALLESLWSVVVGFVDLGFSVDNIDPIFEHIFAAGGEIRHSEGDPNNKNNKEESNE